MMNDNLQSLTPIQRKFIQVTKDTFDKANTEGVKEGYILARKVEHPELEGKEVFQVLANTISKEVNNTILSGLVLNQQQSLNAENPEAESYVCEIEQINSNQFSINEKLKADKTIKDIVCEIPTDKKGEAGLIFRIKFKELSDVKTVGIRFKDGNIASYKFDMMFMNENGDILSEIKGQRNARVTSLIEFYELEAKMEKVDRVVFTITDKYVENNINDNVVNISEILFSNDIVSPELKASRIISAVEVENKASQYNYVNHPSLLKLRIATNEDKYPTLYEIAESVSIDDLAQNNEKHLKIYNSVLAGNIVNTTEDEPILFRISNPNTLKYEDNAVNNSLSTLLKKGYMKYGGYKNRFIAFKIIPLKYDPDNWSIDFVTRGGDIEAGDRQLNLFHAIIQIHKEGFSFNRQLTQNKADVFMEGLEPAFEAKLTQDQEIGIIMYQYNIDETNVQYYIYVKTAQDVEWRLYNSFIDSPKLVGENYEGQTISWGGLFDYIFFREIYKMKVINITMGELTQPIRKID